MSIKSIRVVAFPSIADYNDIASQQQFEEAIAEGYTEEEALQAVWRLSRDNSRTPMQWDDSAQAGFTVNDTPWLKANSNYTKINVKNCLENPDSILHYYQKMIALREKSEYSKVIIDGDYQEILGEDPDIFAYIRKNKERQILIIGNFGGNEKKIDLKFSIKHVILSNYGEPVYVFNRLHPYEALVLEIAV